MKLFYAKLMKLVNFVSTPIKGLVLHNSQRVRVVVVVDNQILLVKSALGSQRWSLPGGGIEKNEAPEAAAVRETLEETGLKLTTPPCFIGQARLPAHKKWPVTNISFYHARLEAIQSPTILRPLEILGTGWFDLSQLPKDISPTVQIGLDFVKQ